MITLPTPDPLIGSTLAMNPNLLPSRPPCCPKPSYRYFVALPVLAKAYDIDTERNAGHPAGYAPTPYTIPAVARICGNCRAIQLHAADALGLG